MSTTRSTPVRRFAAPLTAAAFFAAAAPAFALPVGPGGGGENPPPQHAPVAVLKASPIHALVSTLPKVLQSQKFTGSADLSDALYGGGDAVHLDASASSDQDGDLAKLSWDLDDDGAFDDASGTPATAAKQSVRFYTTGDHIVRVRAQDAGNLVDTAKVTIDVRNPPHAQIASDLTAPLVGQSVNLSAAGSTAEPSLGSVSWDLDGDGTYETSTGTSLTTQTSYATPGRRTVGVRITDAYGASRTASVDVTVNQAPTAAFTNGPATVGEKVTFDGSGSTDDAGVTDYAWDLDGNGSFETDTATTPTVSKTFTAAGDATVRLRVTDAQGATSTVSRLIKVAPAKTTTTSGTAGTAGAAAGSDGGATQSTKLAPKLAFASTKLKLAKSGKVAIKVSCPKTASACIGKITLKTSAKHPASLGSVRFTLKPGQTKTYRVTVPAGKRAAIRRSTAFKANAIVSVADAAGLKGTSTTGILIGL
ncbi:MAG: PKD domain-containing protein [Solirubrobacteraceae bacterium]|nr:PKD domain-containing protein [Patulibacter sp.]